MRYYETMVVFKYDLAEKAIDELVGKIESIIKEDSGEILNSEDWGKKKLSYKINKDEYGIYRLWHHKSGEEVPGKLERFFRISDGIIRFHTILMYKKDIDMYEGKASETQDENSNSAQEEA